MSEPDITPLARRLAEQNNVDWRRLQGSGDGGKIVERDVLDFLARVMAGEEAVDPTPEPLPDGMEAWPDQDMASVRQGVGEAATLGELRQEIGSAVRDEAPAVDEDVFLFDDEPAAAQAATGPTASAGDAVPAVADDLDDLLVSGDEPLPVDDAGRDDDASDLGALAGQADLDAFAAEAPAGAPEVDWGHGIELGDPSPAPAAAAPDIWGEPAVASEDDVDLFSDVASNGADGQDGGAAGYDDADLWAEPSAHGVAAARDPWTDEPTAGQEASPYDAWAAETRGPTASAAQVDAAEPSATEPAAEDSLSTEPAPAAEGFSAEPVAAAEPSAAGPEAAEPSAEPEPEPTVREAVEEPLVGAVAGVESLPLARLRTVLRRHVDVSALASAQLAVSQELGHEEPLGAAAFVLRAVAKAAADVGVGTGQVALAAFGDGLTLRRVDRAATRPFAELVADLSGPGSEEDEAGLVVADLSGLDVDEVVLDVDLPVVSLGRILYDNQRGGYRSTLTLAGDLPAEAGARLLSRVAELLDSPVRLVM